MLTAAAEPDLRLPTAEVHPGCCANTAEMTPEGMTLEGAKDYMHLTNGGEKRRRRICLRCRSGYHAIELGLTERLSGKCGMKWWHVLVLIVVALSSNSSSAADAKVEQFSGSWRGVALQITGDIDLAVLTPGDLDLRIRPEGDGFRINWVAFSRGEGGEFKRAEAEAKFVPTDRPGVFAFATGDSSLLGWLFADPATGNPLQGETLLWARLQDQTLTVYSLAINSVGGFHIDRYAHTLTDRGTVVHYTLRIENDRILTIEGRTEAAGG